MAAVSADTRLRHVFPSLWPIQQAAESNLLQFYRAKMAAAQLCLRGDALAAALAMAAQERDAALRALRAKHSSERDEAREIRRRGSGRRPRRKRARAAAVIAAGPS